LNPQTRKRSGDDTVAARGLGALGTKCWAAGVNIAQCVGARQQITYHQSRARSCEGDIRSDNLDQAIAFGVFCGDGISGGVSHHFARDVTDLLGAGSHWLGKSTGRPSIVATLLLFILPPTS
jgi:hypothetical protein